MTIKSTHASKIHTRAGQKSQYAPKTNTLTVTKVTIMRAEGLTSLCGHTIAFNNLSDAEYMLQTMAGTVQGYCDKVDFTVEFDNADYDYQGTIGLKPEHTDGYSIKNHITDFIKYWATNPMNKKEFVPTKYNEAAKTYSAI